MGDRGIFLSWKNIPADSPMFGATCVSLHGCLTGYSRNRAKLGRKKTLMKLIITPTHRAKHFPNDFCVSVVMLLCVFCKFCQCNIVWKCRYMQRPLVVSSPYGKTRETLCSTHSVRVKLALKKTEK